MTTYSVSDLGRRDILLMAAIAASFGLSGLATTARAEPTLRRTPSQILGPFYPLSEMPQTTDLTRVPGRSGRADGQVLNVMGKVLNLSGEPVRYFFQAEDGIRATSVTGVQTCALPI